MTVDYTKLSNGGSEKSKRKVPKAVPGFEEAIRTILSHIGEDPDREGLRDTPKRVLRAYEEMLSGYHQDPAYLMTCFTEASYDEMIAVSEITVVSFCEHHLLPFVGEATVAYIPDSRVIGLSKIARLVDVYAKRLQMQERLTVQVTRALMEHLKPKGAACYIRCKHLCMCGRGVRKEKGLMTTCSLEGVFKEDSRTRAEFLQLARG